MMSTTGRIPVIAAPTPIPEMPASEMGESITRSGPNSSTRPERTLNGVPASATSSPIKKTRWSRRISSASASLTASANVISRTAVRLTAFSTLLGVDVSIHLRRIRIRSGEREALPLLDLDGNPLVDAPELGVVRVAVFAHPLPQELDGVATRPPLFLL